MAKRHASSDIPPAQIALLCGSDEAAAIREFLEGESVQLVPIGLGELETLIGGGGITAIMVGPELLSRAKVKQLRKAMAAEPTGLDIPILLLTQRDNLDAADELLEGGQVSIVERPLHRGILIRSVRSARRSRERQIADLKTLRDIEERFRFAVELSRQVVWTLEPDGNAVTAGSRLSELTGLPANRYFGDILAQNSHLEDRKAALAAWEESQRTGQPFYHEFRLRIADGSYHLFLSRAVPRCDENGRIVRWYGFIEDINEHKMAMEALRQAEERYRLAARATNDAIWDWNLATDMVAWSDAAAAYLGNEPLEHSSIGWWENAIHPDDRERVMRSIRGTIESDKLRWSAAYRMRKADGDYAYVYDRGFFIRDEDGRAIRAVGAVVDLTERRRAESELRRTQAELIHISRVSAMGTMASTLAHELNQPLTAVTSYVRGSRRLLASFDDPAIAQVCEALEFAEAGALRAGQIVRRLRELVARGAVEVRPENLVRLVQDASVLAFVDEHLHGISHEIRIDPDARWVEVDRIQIQQVLINLTRNAIQALQNSEIRHVTIAARAVEDDMVEVSVADTGSGIPPSIRDALFSPFHSTKAEGMGIGLSISRTIVEAHHGRIWAEDGPQGGTIFRFTLPKADVVENPAGAAGADPEPRHAV